MNIISFTYTKSNGEVSKRVISPTIVPSKNYEGIDLSELEVVDQITYCQELGKIRDELNTRVLELNARFDVEKKYRCFIPSNMTDVVKVAV